MATTLNEPCDRCPKEVCTFCCEPPLSQASPQPSEVDWAARLHGVTAPPEAVAALARKLHGDLMSDSERTQAAQRLHTDERLPASRGRHEDAGEQLEADAWCKRLHE